MIVPTLDNRGGTSYDDFALQAPWRVAVGFAGMAAVSALGLLANAGVLPGWSVGFAVAGMAMAVVLVARV
jgi:hypothetical protein